MSVSCEVGNLPVMLEPGDVMLTLQGLITLRISSS